MDDGYVAYRGRKRQQSAAVFVGSFGVVVAGMFAVFLVAFAACDHALSSLGPKNLDLAPFADVKPIPIPAASCPSLKVVSVAASDADVAWRDLFRNRVPWDRFVRELVGPLASLDGALTAADAHVPEPVADDFRITRSLVRRGRVLLLTETSTSAYVNDSNVYQGFMQLMHASALVGNACGFRLAPPLPF